MKKLTKTLLLILSIGLMTTVVSCDNAEVSCSNQTFGTFAECDKETNDVDCICVQEGNEWKAVPNP